MSPQVRSRNSPRGCGRCAARPGNPPYRQLAQHSQCSVTTLSDAVGGKRLPSLDVTLAYVAACGGDRAQWEPPVPQMLAPVQHRLGVAGGQHDRPPPRLPQPDRARLLRTALGDVLQERLVGTAVATTAGGPHRHHQVAERRPVAGVKLAERRQRGELAVHAGPRAVVIRRGQHRDLPVTGLRRQPQPANEPGDVLRRHRSPVQPPTCQVDEPVLQIVGVRLDRVR